MATAAPNNINEYIAGFPRQTQLILEAIRATIKKAAPEAEETINYAIPTFKLYGDYLIHFAGYKNHISLYPAPRGDEAFANKLAAFKGGKGTVQFPLNTPISLNLITDIVKFLIQKVKEKASKKIKE